MSDQIEKFIAKYKDDQIQLSTNKGCIDWETGKRIWKAQDILEEEFILLYSDNYANCRIDKIVQTRKKEHSTICMLIQPKVKGNIQIKSDVQVECYDNTRSGNYQYVEIGYMSVNKRKLLNSLDKEKCLSKTLEILSNKGELSCIKGDGIYHSISDINRLKLMEGHLKPKKIIMIDRDAINKKPEKMQYISNIKDFVLIDDTVKL